MGLIWTKPELFVSPSELQVSEFNFGPLYIGEYLMQRWTKYSPGKEKEKSIPACSFGNLSLSPWMRSNGGLYRCKSKPTKRQKAPGHGRNIRGAYLAQLIQNGGSNRHQAY